MIQVVLILFLAGATEPDVSLKKDTAFDTIEACRAKLPEFAADFVTNAQKHGRTWGTDFMFALQCTAPRDDGSL